MWLINNLQLQLEATRHLISESQTLTGWINGDLYIQAGERIGILPVPDSIRATADIESYHAADCKFKHAYLAQQQGTTEAAILRKALDQFLAREGIVDTQDPFAELIGMFEGPSEVDHDDIYR